MSIIHVTTVHKRYDIRIFHKELRVIAQHFDDVILIVNDGLGEDVREGIRILDLNKTYKGRFSRLIAPFFSMISLLRLHKPDIIHFHDPELILMGIVMSIMGYAVVYDAHEDVPKDIMGKKWIPSRLRLFISFVFDIIERFSLRFFEAVVLVIESQQERLTHKRNVLLRNYPIIARYPFDCVEKNKGYFIYSGTLGESRGLYEMLEAILLCPEQVYLFIAGRFPNQEELNRAKKHRGWAKVRYFDWIDQNNLINLSRTAIAGLLLFHPTPNTMHCSPNKLFEYMASGIPVIGSDLPSIREVIEQHQSGILVDPQDPKSIYKAMEFFLQHDADRTRMGMNGIEAVRNFYSWENESLKLILIYGELLKTMHREVLA